MSNLTVFQTLEQPTNADGSLKATIAPTRLVENYIDKGRLVEHMDGTFTLDSVTYQPKQSAITAGWLVANIASLPEAFRLAEAGFCTTKQAETALIIAEKGLPKVKAKPLEGHVMTSAEWLQSCIDKLPELPVPDYEGHAALIATINDSMTKAQILEVIAQAKALVNVKVYTIDDCTSEQQDKYYDLVKKETAIAEATSVLSVYLDDIKPVSDTTIQGKFNPLLGTGELFGKLLDQEGYKILVSTDVPAKVVNFIPIEPGYILFSIQVITV